MTIRGTTLAVLALLAPALALGAPGGMTAPPAGAAQQAAPTPMARARAIQEQLAQIRAAAIEGDSALAQQQTELNDLLRETMRENGHTPDADVEKLREIRDDLQDETLSQAEQQTLVREFQSLRAGLAGAREQAMADQEVQAQAQAFQQALLAGMREEDERTDALLQRMSALQGQLQGG